MHIFGTQLYGGSEWVYKFRFATLWDIRRYMVGGQQGIDGSKCSIWKHLKLGHVEILDQNMTWISFLLLTLVNWSHRFKLTIRHPLKCKTEIQGHFNEKWVHNALGLTFRDGWRYQNGFIFVKNSKRPLTPPYFGKNFPQKSMFKALYKGPKSAI